MDTVKRLREIADEIEGRMAQKQTIPESETLLSAQRTIAERIESGSISLTLSWGNSYQKGCECDVTIRNGYTSIAACPTVAAALKKALESLDPEPDVPTEQAVEHALGAF